MPRGRRTVVSTAQPAATATATAPVQNEVGMVHSIPSFASNGGSAAPSVDELLAGLKPAVPEPNPKAEANLMAAAEALDQTLEDTQETELGYPDIRTNWEFKFAYPVRIGLSWLFLAMSIVFAAAGIACLFRGNLAEGALCFLAAGFLK